MIESRACARPMPRSAKKPRPSGPRWSSVAIMRSSKGRALSGAIDGASNPAIPHTARSSVRVRERVRRQRHQVRIDVARGGAIGVGAGVALVPVRIEEDAREVAIDARLRLGPIAARYARM